jgi:hypothetical protein
VELALSACAVLTVLQAALHCCDVNVPTKGRVVFVVPSGSDPGTCGKHLQQSPASYIDDRIARRNCLPGTQHRTGGRRPPFACALAGAASTCSLRRHEVTSRHGPGRSRAAGLSLAEGSTLASERVNLKRADRTTQALARRSVPAIMRGWAAGLLLVVAGCASVGTSFTPDKAEYRHGASPQVSKAFLAYRGDLPALLEAGGVVLGQMEGNGNGFAGQGDVEERVRERAAEWGATHVVFISASNEEDHTPVEYHTTCAGNAVGRYASADCTTTTSGGVRFYRPHAGYTLIRVPSSNIPALPVALGGQGLAQRQPAEAPVPSDAAPATAPPIPAPEHVGPSEQVRSRCKDQARERFGLALDDANESGSGRGSREADAGSGWAARYTAARDSAAAQPPASADEQALQQRRQDASAWYRGCVARGGRVLAEAPAHGDPAISPWPAGP